MATVSLLAVLRARSFMQFDRFLPVLLNNNNNNNNNIKQSIKKLGILEYCSKSDNTPVAKTNDLNDTDGSEKPTKKKVGDIKITLLLPDDSLLVTDLENANKISKRRGLILTKVEDVQKKTGRPVYKLMSQTDQLHLLLEDDEDEKQSVIKSIKTIQISNKITLHDMQIKLKNIVKLLERKHKVKVIVVHGSTVQDKVIKSIEVSTKNHGTIQKIGKSTSTIFTITPILNEKNNNNLDVVESKES